MSYTIMQEDAQNDEPENYHNTIRCHARGWDRNHTAHRKPSIIIPVSTRSINNQNQTILKIMYNLLQHIFKRKKEMQTFDLHLEFFTIGSSPFNFSSLPFMNFTTHLYHILLLLQLPTFNPFFPVNIPKPVRVQVF